MTIHGDTFTAGEPELGAAAAAAVLRAFDHRHEVAHLLYTATDEADATGRIAALLAVDPETVRVILAQPLRGLLPEHRARLLAATEAPAASPTLDIAANPTPTPAPGSAPGPVPGPGAAVAPAAPEPADGLPLAVPSS